MEKLTEKIIVLGIDGMDPSLTKKFIDEGLMPNMKKYMALGSAREDLVMLGAMPTVTPPMWTTLATGAYPATHGITAFMNPAKERCDGSQYALDSADCLAEPIWNVFAESGKKTLVWHWPGSSWPPTSNSTNLSVVDGAQPAGVNMGVATTDWETMCYGNENIKEIIFAAHNAPQNPGVGCVISDLSELSEPNTSKGAIVMQAILKGNANKKVKHGVLMDDSDSEIETLGNVNLNVVNSPIKEATGWLNAPEGAKEMIILHSDGLMRRPCLILKNADGIYDTIQIYKSKKEPEPLVTVKSNEYVMYYFDEIIYKDERMQAYRAVSLLDIAEDGSDVRLWMSVAYKKDENQLWSPKEFHDEIKNNVGYVPTLSMAAGKVPEFADRLLARSLDYYCDWQAEALMYCMDNGYEAIFSHLHNIDLIGHQIWHLAKHRDNWNNDEVFYQNLFRRIYTQTDTYLGKFIPYIEKGWTILIVSDHGLITEENHTPLIEAGNNCTFMVDLGYTVMKKDADGNVLREIDLSKTTAVLNRCGHVMINLKSRYPDGIVDDTDKYELERKIIDDLYAYRDPHTGKRIISMALRNKDAAVIGMNGDRCGDIVLFVEEGFNIIHADGLSTGKGYFDTSVSPIFLAAGKGIKSNFTTDRVVRQVDITPTIAVLGGVRMPAQCEGAPLYQILNK
ncbi:MAG: alkaline phosphatase family protein [Peptococcaceae bacterium]|nr:alkaline phosphatase family protein [Peptococcaceae bacterium]MBO5429585.1 alkaline phosphatase family protein [Peptococcaceae bacterium]